MQELILCKKCGSQKALDQFQPGELKGHGSKKWPRLWCRACVKESSRAWYENSGKQKLRDNQLRYQRRNQQYAFDYLLQHPCMDCGEVNPICLDFDHLGDKSANICDLVGKGSCSLERLQNEIAKCEIRCRNCHQIKTAQNFNHFRYKAWLDHLKKLGDSSD